VRDGSLQNHSGANLHPKTAKDRGNVPKGGKADGVALTSTLMLSLDGVQMQPLPLFTGKDDQQAGVPACLSRGSSLSTMLSDKWS
jgi:hypothetical protein